MTGGVTTGNGLWGGGSEPPRRPWPWLLLGVGCFALALALGGCSFHSGGMSLDFGRAAQRTQVATGQVTTSREGEATVRGVEILEVAPPGFWDLLDGLIARDVTAPPETPRTRAAWLEAAACDPEVGAALVRMLERYEELATEAGREVTP